MTKKVQIQLPTPCTQSWEDMKSVPGGKFCSSCEKNVIDFSLLNDRQILEIISNNKTVCGRFTAEQLNRELRVTAPQSNAFIPALIVSTALATGVATTAYAARDMERTVIVQDTTKPVAKIPADTSECDMDYFPGYAALGQDLVVTGYWRPPGYVTGVIIVRHYETKGELSKQVKQRSFEPKKKKGWFF